MPRPAAPRLGGAAILLGVVALVGVLAAPGSLAFWQQHSAAPGVGLTVGSAGIRLDRTAGQPVPAVYPGSTRPIDATTAPSLVNTGDVPVEIRLAAAVPVPVTNPSSPSSGDLALAAELRLTAWLAPASSECASPPTGAVIWAATPGAADPGSAASLGTLPAAATRTLCITVGLPLSASAATATASPAGISVPLTVTATQASP